MRGRSSWEVPGLLWTEVVELPLDAIGRISDRYLDAEPERRHVRPLQRPATYPAGRIAANAAVERLVTDRTVGRRADLHARCC